MLYFSKNVVVFVVKLLPPYHFISSLMGIDGPSCILCYHFLTMLSPNFSITIILYTYARSVHALIRLRCSQRPMIYYNNTYFIMLSRDYIRNDRINMCFFLYNIVYLLLHHNIIIIPCV